MKYFSMMNPELGELLKAMGKSERERIRQLTDRRSELIVLENDIRRFLDEWSKKYLEITERIIDNNLSIERGKEEDSKIYFYFLEKIRI